jgi:acyl carrier protein
MPLEVIPMDREAVIRELDPIFQDILDQPDLRLTPESNASNVEGWDSLAHVNLVMAIEQQMRVRFALGELQALKNVGEMADLIIKKRPRA